ncbi:hypothetical protein ABID22_003262 [Pontibacter aydingkolensis]|uniref:Uncharacterized protein n=1 Tax=Pontibacter aydingkolensis TaxID=1911536 RepID=A0ABS7CS54_9BACT|nr:hypothetical protein [Pontibacter aydingkolensis]MBW7466660.1 hypothetical protein [Pontibacter aydingkolensis]
MKITYSETIVPSFSRLVAGQAAVSVPPDISHFYHSFFKEYFGETISQHSYALKYVYREGSVILLMAADIHLQMANYW